MQGLLWSETLVTPQMMEYMLLPKLLGLSERAWSTDPAWSSEPEPMAGTAYWKDWSQFVNRVGKRELPKLDHLSGGFAYRIPTPGVVATANGAVQANIQLPGLNVTIYYRWKRAGCEQSRLYTGPVTAKGNDQSESIQFEWQKRKKWRKQRTISINTEIYSNTSYL